MDILRSKLDLTESDVADDVRFHVLLSPPPSEPAHKQDVSVVLSGILVSAVNDTNPRHTLDQVYRAITAAELTGEIVSDHHHTACRQIA